LDFFEVILYGFYHGKSRFFTIIRGRFGSFFPSILRRKSKGKEENIIIQKDHFTPFFFAKKNKKL